MFKIIGNGSFGKALRAAISYCADRDDLFSDEDYHWVILSVPSYALPKIEIEVNKKYILVSKGMVEHESGAMFVTEWAENMKLEYVYIAGPHLASELMQNMPSASTIASKNHDYFYQLEQYFPGPVYSSKPLLNAISGVVKNIIAYACGMYAALQLGENFNSCILMQGAKEICNIAKEFKIDFDYNDIITPAVIADLILTGGSKQSRNYISGYNKIKEMPSEHLTEAHHSSVALIKRIGYSQNKWPIISLVASMIDGDLSNSGDLLETWRECITNFSNI